MEWSETIAIYRALFLAHNPTRKARMNSAGARAKYTTLRGVVRDDEIVAHLSGRLTLAAPLVGDDGLAYAAALDIDTGGSGEVSKVLAAAHERHLYAFAVTSQNHTHDGGHVWLLFDGATNPQRLRAVANELAQAANVAAETYPTQKTLRLPLGVHRRSGRRGRLLVPGQRIINLDHGMPTVLEALKMIAHLPRNCTDALPALPQVVSLREPGTQYKGTAGAPGKLIQTYNQTTDMIALLESYGGGIAFRLLDGSVMMHCPCPNHAHGDQQPSLEVQPAIAARYGRYIAFGYAPGCLFYTEAGRVFDAFGVYCQLERVTAAEAVYQLYVQK